MLESKEQRTEGMKKQAQELIEQAYNRGYKAGYEACKEPKDALIDKGRKEAWEVADKLNRMRMDEVIKVFENDPLVDALTRESIFSSCSPELAIEKVMVYEEKKKQEEDSEIRVGDEVYLCDSTAPRAVTCIFENYGVVTAVQITENGRWVVDNIRNLHKTGRHFPEIENVLKKMQEGKEKE